MAAGPADSCKGSGAGPALPVSGADLSGGPGGAGANHESVPPRDDDGTDQRGEQQDRDDLERDDEPLEDVDADVAGAGEGGVGDLVLAGGVEEECAQRA